MPAENRDNSSPESGEQGKATSAENEVVDVKAGTASENTGSEEPKEDDAATKARERQERFKALRARAVSSCALPP